MQEFKGKTLVISGGTRGIGKAIVYEFAKVGVNIAFTYNSNADIARDMVEDLQTNYKIKAKAYEFNILEPESYKELFEKIDLDFDRIDFFISNAIISGRAVVGGYTKFMKLKPKGINNIFTATVNAFVVGTQEAAKRMEKIGGGSVISISSTGNLVHIENYAGHGTAKAAVEVMMKYAATELGDKNIRVNVVSGGPIDTDALKAFTNYEEVKQATIDLSPLNRIGQPSDLAGACLFLCSSKASWVTGHTFIVDGGTTFK
ncbi:MULTISPECIES: enoyl-ACP reductase [unclassified Campylobacter]|uniref:enoyl-ACP reductase n=1 Tax=unclassified Campylobacter TaxID=2593542 RepID=UPI001237DA56|nr:MULTISPECIES: enoyl-ACP reductase [unclassified Campylobacter]KAA6225361.1 enoyl-ACP reductase [Campylobacter sp. LR185c]KAA6227057.1 enoyl-ACP reductase [Campylobacter sp. LR196d]KAA6227628.1 enoyl-ACP reductase [Campylobacter sp. LR286c]KAA6229493.1 enoyl-ACP reductase [Campylobacter sp. LR264d]KAA6230737.1 enoyl-ACP reductase [Campylobacter sp. LR291e]